MDVTWGWVVIAACVALAAVIVAALALRTGPGRRPRPLANVERLTRLPAYLRAMRRRRMLTAATLTLLAVAFGAAVMSAARPTGLPGPARDTVAAQPEDVMVCAGAPADSGPMTAALRYFASTVPSYTDQRVGLTTPDRRVIPLTRDYRYAATRFADYAATARPPAVAYADYASTVDDVIALCITGFPSFDRVQAQRRSVVYVGPGADRDARPLFDVATLRDLAGAAGVQVNAVMTDSDSGVLEELARDTGGRYVAPYSDVGASLAGIRDNPPAAAAGDVTRAAAPETPELPLVLALLAVGGLLTLTLVMRP